MKSDNLRPPFLGQQVPDYPALPQIIRNTGTSAGTNVYTGFVQQYDASTPLRDRENCYLLDANAVSGGLPAGYYGARLMGNYQRSGGNCYPLFVTGEQPGSGGVATSAAYARVVTQSAAGSLGGDAYTATATTLTKSSNGALPNLDSVVMAAGDKVLFLLEGVAHADYGLYTVTSLGSGGAPWILTRTNGVTPVAGLEVYISIEGPVNQGTVWQLNTANPIASGSTAQLWSRAYEEIRPVKVTSTSGSDPYPGSRYNNHLDAISLPLSVDIHEMNGFVPLTNKFYKGVRSFDASGVPVYNINAMEAEDTGLTTWGPYNVVTAFNPTSCVATIDTFAWVLRNGESVIYT